LASFGAIVTVVALAMDPFAQQILRFPTMMLDAGNGTALIRNAYGYGQYWTVDGQGPRAREIAAIMSGVFHGTEALEADYSCSTGNCTWDPFDTLGICSKCFNLTELVTPDCANLSMTDGIRQTCTYYVFEGEEIYTEYKIPNVIEKESNCTARQTSVNRVANSPVRLEIPTATAADLFTGSLANVTMMQANDCTGSAPRMYLCELAFCKKRILSSVTSGVLEEVILQSETLIFPECGSTSNQWWNTGPAPYDSLCAGYTPGEVPSAATGIAIPTDITSLDTQTNAMWVNGTFASSMKECLEELLDSSKVIGREIAWIFWALNAGNFTLTFEDIASSMTNRLIRQGPNRNWIKGSAKTPSVVVEVHWEWFSLPAALGVLSIAFLSVSIWVSNRPGRLVWKSSVLATLFHQDDGLCCGSAGKENIAEMDEIARRMDVVLRTDLVGRTSFRS
jgi:hypothetical protein